MVSQKSVKRLGRLPRAQTQASYVKRFTFSERGEGDVLAPLLLNLPFRDLWPSAEKPVRNVPEVPSCAVLLNQCIKMSK